MRRKIVSVAKYLKDKTKVSDSFFNSNMKTFTLQSFSIFSSLNYSSVIKITTSQHFFKTFFLDKFHM